MYVCFVGISGAGKTTTAKETVDILESKYNLSAISGTPFFRKERSKFYRFFWLIYIWRFYNRKIVSFYRKYTTSGSLYSHASLKEAVYAWYRPLMYKYRLFQLSSRNVDVLVDDEPFFAFSIEAYKKGDLTKSELLSFFNRQIRPVCSTMLIVWVNVPVTVAIQRRLERDIVGVQSIEKVKKTKEDKKEVVSVIENISEDISLIEIDSTKKIEVNAKFVAKEAYYLLSKASQL